MRIVLIADTHGSRPTVPAGDVLIHCGDLTHLGSFAELKNEVEWLKSLPHPYKLFVPGNHDVACYNILQNGKESQLQKFLEPIIYLRDSGTVIEGLKIWGSPWVRENSGGEFNLPSTELLSRFQKIPKDVEVLITHTPPHGMLDTLDGEHIGSPELTRVMRSLPGLRLACFGHIHEAAGITKQNEVTLVNAAQQLTPDTYIVDIAPTPERISQ